MSSSTGSVCRWISRNVNVDNTKRLQKVEVTDHPLKHATTKANHDKRFVGKSNVVGGVTKASEGLTYVLDPVGLMVTIGDDPLSMFQKNNKPDLQLFDEDDLDDANDNVRRTRKGDVESWSVRREFILMKYHDATENLKIYSSYALHDSENSPGQLKTDKPTAAVTQQEFSRQLENFHQEILAAWNADQRVEALKLVIDRSKLLSDAECASFYPNKFVYVTDILDSFGQLVYNRLRSKCITLTGNADSARISKLTLDMVPETTKETCRNWFYKITAIRELIPRFYVEAALIRCYSFIIQGDEGKILLRLTKTIRGIGNPLVAIFARCYLCRIGVDLHVKDFSFFKENLYEFLLSYEHIFNRNMHLSKKFELPKYLDAFTPALCYIVQGVVANTSVTVHSELVKLFKEKPNNCLLLYCILSCFPSDYVINNASDLLRWISKVDNEAGIAMHRLLEQLGEHFQIDRPLNQFDTVKPELLHDVWQLISRIRTADQYVSCVELWMPISVSYFTIDKMDELLADIIRHLNNGSLCEIYSARLRNIWRGILENVSDVLAVFVMKNFLPFVDMFHSSANDGSSSSSRLIMCKISLEYLVKRTREISIMAIDGGNDDGDHSVLLDNLMYIAKTLHDSVTALTVDDEKRQIGQLICNWLIKIDFERHFEKQLTFYVDARGSFFNFHIVHSTLVQCVNRMCMEILSAAATIGKTRRRGSKMVSFVKACAAYCFITIPSISSEIDRMQLYLLSGQVALANQCYGQAEACLNAAITLIGDFPHTLSDPDGKQRNLEPILVSYVSELLSILLIVPDNPSSGRRLSLVRRLVNTLRHYSWEEYSVARSQLYVQALHMLSVATRQSYPYHVPAVDSNDVLYSWDDDFVTEVNQIASVILEQILKHMQILDTGQLLKKQADLALSLFNCVMIRTDVNERSMAKLALSLWKLAHQNGLLDSRLEKRTASYYQQRKSGGGGCNHDDDDNMEIYGKLLAALQY